MVLFLRYEVGLIILKDIYFIFSIPATALGLTPEPPSLILNICRELFPQRWTRPERKADSTLHVVPIFISTFDTPGCPGGYAVTFFWGGGYFEDPSWQELCVCFFTGRPGKW